MHNYDLATFCRYYTGSFILHPTNDTIVKVMGASRQVAEAVSLSDKTHVRLSELDWNHVQTPQLGYRTMLDGKALYYVTRRAGRLTEKGVTPSAIVVEIPSIVQALSNNLDSAEDLQKHCVLEQRLADVIFRPEFTPLPAAVQFLKDRKHSIAFAVSNNWAVTLGLYKTQPFLLHFKNQTVAHSMDGEKWDFLDEDAEIIFNKSSIR